MSVFSLSSVGLEANSAVQNIADKINKTPDDVLTMLTHQAVVVGRSLLFLHILFPLIFVLVFLFYQWHFKHLKELVKNETIIPSDCNRSNTVTMTICVFLSLVMMFSFFMVLACFGGDMVTALFNPELYVVQNLLK